MKLALLLAGISISLTMVAAEGFPSISPSGSLPAYMLPSRVLGRSSAALRFPLARLNLLRNPHGVCESQGATCEPEYDEVSKRFERQFCTSPVARLRGGGGKKEKNDSEKDAVIGSKVGKSPKKEKKAKETKKKKAEESSSADDDEQDEVCEVVVRLREMLHMLSCC